MQYIAVCGSMMVIALAVFPVPTLGFELPKYVALSCVATLAAYSFLIQREFVLGVLLGSRQGKVFLAFAAVVVASALWSVAPLASVLGVAPRYQGVLTYVCVFILAATAAVLAKRTQGRDMLLLGFQLSNTAVVLYGVLQMLQLDPLRTFWNTEAFLGRVFSTLGHPNMLGQFIVLTLPFVALAIAKAEERIVRMWWLAVATLNIVVLFGTVSRSALLGAGVLLLLCLPSLKKWLRIQRKSIKAEQGFTLSFVVVLCSSIGLMFFAQRFQSSFEMGRSTAARQVIWSNVLDMIWHQPIGWGLDVLAFTSPRFMGKEVYLYESLTTVIDRAHNVVLQLLVTVGPLGLVLFGWLIGSVLLAAWKVKSSADTSLLQTAAAGVAAYIVTLVFGFPSIATLAFFWISMGCIIGLLANNEVDVLPWKEAALQLAIVFLATATAIVSLQWMQARWVHAYARSIATEDPAIALAVHQEGLLMFGYDRESIIETAQAHLLALEQQPGQQNIEDSVVVMIDMLRQLTSNQDGTVYLLTAWLEAIKGNAEESKKALQEGKKYYYQSTTYHRAAQHVYELLGDGVGVQEQKTYLRGLLPDAYFTEGSETRRILRKQHPWLETL